MRLLNTPIVGITAAIVDSSWIDMLAGLAKSGICKMPPGFCARAGPTKATAKPNPPAAKKTRNARVVGIPAPCCRAFPEGYHLSDRAAYREAGAAMVGFPRCGVLLPERVSIIAARCTCSGSAAGALLLVETPDQPETGVGNGKEAILGLSSMQRPICRATRPPCASRCRCCWT